MNANCDEQTVERERRIASVLKSMVFGRRRVNRIVRQLGDLELNTRRKHVFWNAVLAAIGFATFAFMMLVSPHPEADCTQFTGTLVSIHQGGRRDTPYVVIATHDGEKRLRSNNRTINRAMYQSGINARFSGLLDDWGHIVALSIDGSEVLDYQGYVEDLMFERQLCAWPALLVGAWGLVDCCRWLRRST